MIINGESNNFVSIEVIDKPKLECIHDSQYMGFMTSKGSKSHYDGLILVDFPDHLLQWPSIMWCGGDGCMSCVVGETMAIWYKGSPWWHGKYIWIK